ncbi:hypothetical protein K466DRAFT_651540 [Polyporus arcularius HHB13444]|uniref:Uncharacterized protein n=1 Tax=Polyporus arcularius HHB13444 TaxID=1314778 RepID=A0A5C3PKX7_9APHY|nr:hypothetical protein K466DRAFT_651540 [Polyporus arcularius HHB13444]
MRITPSERDLMYERIVKTMYPENQDFIRTLKGWKSTDKATFHPGGVFATNMFEVTDLPGYDEFGCSGLARDISRVNHSCCANAHVAFDLETLTAAHRQEELKRRYGFNDYFRQTLVERFLRCKEDDLLFAQWVMDGAPVTIPVIHADCHEDMNGLRLEQVTWDLCMREGYVYGELWKPVLPRLVKGYSVLKDEFKVSFYATVAGKLSRTFTGTDRGWDAVARKPRKTDWWGKLDRKRRWRGTFGFVFPRFFRFSENLNAIGV